MPLPELIEIQPLTAPVRAEIVVPGSKSITNRALVLAALAEGKTTLTGALWSEDTQVMVECLKTLGYSVTVEPEPEPEEICNRRITVEGRGRRVPAGGARQTPLDLFVGNAGTVARFLTAMVCLGQGYYRLRGVPRMHERPQAELFQALRQMGYQIESPNDRLPVVIAGGGRAKPGGCGQPADRAHISIAESSQFASALLLCAHRGQWDIEVVGPPIEDAPYVGMTQQLHQVFPHQGGIFAIEPDASSGSYFWAANEIQRLQFGLQDGIRVAHWPASNWQIDAGFPRFLPLSGVLSRNRDLADSIMTAIVLAPWAAAPVQFTDLGRLRVQECERVAALRTELSRCGARIVEQGDTLEVYPGPPHGAVIETYGDHRMAMCFALLGLCVSGIKIKHPACVKKTFPNFFQKLAAPAPKGLGAVIGETSSHQSLRLDQLFAD